jgi:hypothetical protein
MIEVVLAVGSLLLLTGCFPESKCPLSSPAKSRIDGRLEGVYAQRSTDKKEKDPGYWHFHYRGAPAADNSHTPRTTPWLELMGVEPRDDGGLQTTRYEALATTIAGRDYLSFVEVSEVSAAMTGREAPFRFARYEVNWRGDVRLWLADTKAFAAAIKSGKLRGTVVKGKFTDTVKITDSTERLAGFIAASDPKVLFSGDALVLRRVR